jgi:hypothetical protein
MGAFSWDIKAGDFIFVRDRKDGGVIVGSGVVKGSPGSTAYRFDARSPIVSEAGEVWKHLIDVDWDPTFSEIPFRESFALQNVRKLSTKELRTLQVSLRNMKDRKPAAGKATLLSRPIMSSK